MKTIATTMADLNKNGGLALAPNQLPAPQPLPSILGMTQYLGNDQLIQYMAANVVQNKAGVQEMLKGKFKALGITEIVTGIISIIIGTVQVSLDEGYDAFSILSGAPWWNGVLFIIAGSLAVAVERSPTDCMIKGCLSMNIISAIFCLPAVIMYSINISMQPCCYYERPNYYDQSGTVPCLAILLVLALLNGAISIAISSFNCKAVTCCNASPVPIIVVYNNPSAQPNPSLQANDNATPYDVTLTVMEHTYQKVIES
uniref:membrane-spanning 4-domains subfamily A member 8-like isoform X1 n=2 Tax=Pristiophorus japonicus TaxID=55135 RepID=UPI00398E9518